MITYRADVPTDAPARYAKQLVAHLGRKVPTETSPDGRTSTLLLGGSRGTVVPGDGVLTLLVQAPDEPAADTARHVLGSHLERFGQRSELQVRWHRTADAPA